MLCVALSMIFCYVIGINCYVNKFVETKQTKQRIERALSKVDKIAEEWNKTLETQKFIDSITDAKTPELLKEYKIAIYLFRNNKLKYLANSSPHTENVTPSIANSFHKSPYKTSIRVVYRAYDSLNTMAVAVLNLTDQNNIPNSSILKYQDESIEIDSIMSSPTAKPINIRGAKFFIDNTAGKSLKLWFQIIGWLGIIFLLLSIHVLLCYSITYRNVLFRISLTFVIFLVIRFILHYTGIIHEITADSVRMWNSSGSMAFTMLFSYIFLNMIYANRNKFKKRIDNCSTAKRFLILFVFLLFVCALSCYSYVGMSEHIHSGGVGLQLQNISMPNADTVLFFWECAMHAGVLVLSILILRFHLTHFSLGVKYAILLFFCLLCYFLWGIGLASVIILIGIILLFPYFVVRGLTLNRFSIVFILSTALISSYIASFAIIDVDKSHRNYVVEYTDLCSSGCAVERVSVDDVNRSEFLQVAFRSADTLIVDSRYDMRLIDIFNTTHSDTVFVYGGMINSIGISQCPCCSGGVIMASIPYSTIADWLALWGHVTLWIIFITGNLLLISNVNVLTNYSHRSTIYRVRWVLFICSIMSMVLIVLVVYSHFNRRLTHSLDDDLSTFAVSVQNDFDRFVIKEGLYDCDYDSVLVALSPWVEAMRLDNKLAFGVYDSTMWLAYCDRDTILNKALPDDVRRAFVEDENSYQRIIGAGSFRSHSIAYLRYGLSSKSDVSVYLAVIMPHTKYSNYAMEFLYGSISTAVAIVLIAIMMSYLLYSIITRPIGLLYLGMRGVRDMQKVDIRKGVSYDNEIGMLIIQYNQLLDFFSTQYMAIARNEQELAWRRIARQVAHDVKNPLTPMRLGLQMLSHFDRKDHTAFSEKVNSTTKLVLEQIDVIIGAVDQLSDVSRYVEKPSVEVNLVELIKNTTDFYTKPLGIGVTLKLGEQRCVMISGDSGAYNRVLINLIKNSVEAIDGKGEITISLSVQEYRGFAVVEFCDTGGGIPESIIGNIFKPDITTKATGSGIGLTICRGIMESFGGSITVRNRRDGVSGACFVLRFKLMGR